MKIKIWNKGIVGRFFGNIKRIYNDIKLGVKENVIEKKMMPREASSKSG